MSNTTKVVNSDIGIKIDKYIDSRTEKNSFSGSILVSHGDDILLNKGYGMANVELDVPNTTKTKFRIGSLTKQFTSMAIMQLVEEGKLKLQDKLEKFLLDFPKGDKITIHHLLTHSSGIFNYTNAPEFHKMRKEFHSPTDLINFFKDKPFDFEPGERYLYSNSGYILLGYIIEKASSMTYEEFLNKNIFRILSMNNSGYDSNKIIKNRASGYSTKDKTIENSSFIDMSVPYSAGALYSTVEDLHLWNKYIINKNEHNSNITNMLFKQHIERKDFLGRPAYHGYGWNIVNSVERCEDKKKIVVHAGMINGFLSINSINLDEKISIIILSNFDFIDIQETYNTIEKIIYEEI